MFKKYQHIEKYGNEEVQGIEIGFTYIFPKLDGTNASVWLENGEVKAGSRNRELTPENDNAGFCKWVMENEKLKNYFKLNPNHRLYGEWLVPHTLKKYRDDAWRNFYIFDIVFEKEGEHIEYVPYNVYYDSLSLHGLDFVPCLRVFKNAGYDYFINELKNNTYLIKNGEGIGEGIVIKNYDFYNKYRRQVWAKIVGTDFKDKHRSKPPITERPMLEEEIVEKFLTDAFIEKEYAKIAIDGWSSKLIPKLLGIIWHEFIVEETWNIIKKYKNPKIDYKILNRLVVNKVKKVKSDLF